MDTVTILDCCQGCHCNRTSLYSIFEGLAAMTNISRYDLPDPKAYRQFFRLHPLYDFPSLQSTCTFFR